MNQTIMDEMNNLCSAIEEISASKEQSTASRRASNLRARIQAANNPQVAYASYCAAVGGKAFNGDPLPKWEEFANDPAKKKQAAAWRTCVAALFG